MPGEGVRETGISGRRNNEIHIVIIIAVVQYFFQTYKNIYSLTVKKRL